MIASPAPKLYTVPVICCHCKERIGEQDGFTRPEATHGICEPCKAQWLASMQRAKASDVSGVFLYSD